MIARGTKGKQAESSQKKTQENDRKNTILKLVMNLKAFTRWIQLLQKKKPDKCQEYNLVRKTRVSSI